jgi:DNA-binding protein WhiA
MSYSADVKAELCRLPLHKKCCQAAEIYGILLFCNTFSKDEVRIVTESRPFVQRTEKLFHRAFGWDFDRVTGPDSGEGKVLLSIRVPEKLEAVFARFGYERSGVLAHHINLSLLEQECCRASFMRGAFLAGGSVTDPRKHYHLELVTGHYNVSNETVALLHEMGFTPGRLRRGGSYVCYFKQSETVEDLLTTLGARLSAMEMMNAKVEKDMRNAVNRKVNCDTANVEKTVAAAQEQLAAIRRLESSGRLKDLGDGLREAARLRLAHPEANLSELASLAEPPLTKSGLSHRLRKLCEIAEEVESL